MRKDPNQPVPQSTRPAPAESNPARDPGASPRLPGGGVSNDLSQQFKAAQRASNEVAIARISNREGAGVKEWQAAGVREWQTYQTPVSPPNTPNMQAAAQSQQAIERGYSLQSSGPTETPRWVPSTQGSPAQETQQAGRTLQQAGVMNDNAPLSESARAQLQAALDNSARNGQTVGGESRVQEAARQASISAPTPESMDKSLER